MNKLKINGFYSSYTQNRNGLPITLRVRSREVLKNSLEILDAKTQENAFPPPPPIVIKLDIKGYPTDRILLLL